MSFLVHAVLTAAIGLTSVGGGHATAPSPADEFTACMRAHGLPDFPTATIAKDGRLQLLGDGRFDPFSETYRRALSACRPIEPITPASPAEPAAPTPPHVEPPIPPIPPR